MKELGEKESDLGGRIFSLKMGDYSGIMSTWKITIMKMVKNKRTGWNTASQIQNSCLRGKAIASGLISASAVCAGLGSTAAVTTASADGP
jgi:hypothetical protein